MGIILCATAIGERRTIATRTRAGRCIDACSVNNGLREDVRDDDAGNNEAGADHRRHVKRLMDFHVADGTNQDDSKSAPDP
jgi:hypothetical protein